MQRRSNFIQAGTTLVVWAAVVCAVGACKAPDDGDATNTNGGVTVPVPPGGTPGHIDDAAGFVVNLTGVSATKYVLHDTSDTTTWTTPCKVLETATGNATNIFCTIEAPEADLYYQGLSFVYNVPTTMCKYFWVAPYGFYAQEVADGESSVTYWVDKTGRVGVDNNNDGVVDTLGAVLDGTGTPSTLASYANGKVSCIYDKSASKAKNCCTGKYGLTVFVWDPSANPPTGAYKPTSTANNAWGGSTADCYAGPYKDLSIRNDKDGLPDSTVYYTDGIGLNKTMTLDAPNQKGYGSNVYIANYINPADHGVPGVPAALLNPITSDPAPPTNRYYDLGCMDQAFEYKARIRVEVREFNLYSEWAKKGTGVSDTTGLESPPYQGAGNNDVADWRDFELAFPGAAWPGFFF